jgi:folate-dependent phosphoribosylglycinamide formyltransferase PurN
MIALLILKSYFFFAYFLKYSLCHIALVSFLKIHASLRANFAGRNERQRSLAFRKQQLGQLVYMVTDHRDAWLAALRADVGRHEFESDMYVLSA